MGFFTSAYKALAHAAPNWDTQLRTDMAFLETNIDQGSWAPGFSGTGGATRGTGGGADGNVVRLGQRVTYFGRVVFGSSGVFGGSLVGALNVYGTMNPNSTHGYGYFQSAAGDRVALSLVPSSDPTLFGVFVVTGSQLAALSTLGTPSAGSQLFFHVDGILA